MIRGVPQQHPFWLVKVGEEYLCTLVWMLLTPKRSGGYSFGSSPTAHEARRRALLVHPTARVVRVTTRRPLPPSGNEKETKR